MRGLLDELEHRGPDDSGLLALREREVALSRDAGEDLIANAVLIHRRLSIIDLSSAGWQPMHSSYGRKYIVFNGEIYNYVELRSQLAALGYRFLSESDTEVLLAAYSEWGPGALSRLTGMFAFAVIDIDAQKLFIARDFFGIKPLYYAQWQDGFVFASEINAILRLPGFSRRVNAQRLYDYLRFGITDHGGETMFGDIKQLPPAHFLEVSLETVHVTGPTRYWNIDLGHKAELSFDRAAQRLRDLFLESVSLHLRSDVPIGAALSGGVDSSSIVAVMRHLHPDLAIHAFSYIAEDPAVSEERWVDVVGASSNLIVHKVKPKPEELASDLEALVALQGECFASSSIYAQQCVFREAQSAGMKVMLDGQGADEMFGGYENYTAARFASLLRRGNVTEAIRFFRNSSKRHTGDTWRMWLRGADFLIPASLQASLRSWIGEPFMPRWLNSGWFDDRNVKYKSFGYRSGTDVLRQALWDTVTETSLPALLRYEDRNSMAFSIESRVPFLTPALVEFVFALPEEYIIAPDGTTKAIFRKAMEGIVPDSILRRRDKIGFATPEKQWLLALRPWVEGLIRSEAAMRIPAINVGELQREWRDIAAGDKRFSFRVWRWLNTILWVEKFGVEFG
jgi:asparagine synthase (glutamine-hydrolysing)